MNRRVKVYGIQRSGNNWLMWLLAANFDVEVLGAKVSGSTHAQMNLQRIAELQPERLFIIAKHPLAWLPSIWRYRGDGLPFVQFAELSNEIEKWNKAYAGWLADSRRLGTPTTLVRYEDWLAMLPFKLHGLAHQEPVPLPIRKDVPVTPAGASWKLPTGKMGLHMNLTRQGFDPSYYVEKRYERYYQSAGRMRQVMERIDPAVLQGLGYRRDA